MSVVVKHPTRPGPWTFAKPRPPQLLLLTWRSFCSRSIYSVFRDQQWHSRPLKQRLYRCGLVHGSGPSSRTLLSFSFRFQLSGPVFLLMMIDCLVFFFFVRYWFCNQTNRKLSITIGLYHHGNIMLNWPPSAPQFFYSFPPCFIMK